MEEREGRRRKGGRREDGGEGGGREDFNLCSELQTTALRTHMLDERLGDLEVVVEGSQVEGSEAIILRLVDVAAGREVLQQQPHGSHVPPQGSVVQRSEPVVVAKGDVGPTL